MPMPFQIWRASLLPASWRGIEFKVESNTIAVGRRNVPHDFAKSETNYTEDMGRRGRRYPVTGYVIGDDFQASRDALIDACETIGPGTLVHPSYGDVFVNCDVASFTENREHGGICTIEMQFVEAGQLPDDSIIDDTQGAAGAAASNLNNAASSSLNNSVAPSGGALPNARPLAS